jgi:hypothetical protein
MTSSRVSGPTMNSAPLAVASAMVSAIEVTAVS